MSERLQAVMAKAYATVPQERLIDAHELAKVLSLRDNPREIYRLAKTNGWPMVYVSKQIIRFEASAVLAAIKRQSCENQPQRPASRTQPKERS